MQKYLKKNTAMECIEKKLLIFANERYNKFSTIRRKYFKCFARKNINYLI